MLAGALRSLIVEDSRADAHFAGLATTRSLGIGAYTGVPLRRADGTLYGTLCALTPTARAPLQGEPALLALAGRLIVQAVEAVALRESEHQLRREVVGLARRFRALSEHATDLVALLDAEGTYTYASASHRRILGYAPEELVGRSVFGLMHPDDRPHIEVVFSAGVRRPGAVEAVEFRMRHRDGSWRWVEAIGNNRLNDPDAWGVSVNSRDITERKEAERALGAEHRRLEAANRELARSNADLEQFATIAAHDLQEPLRLIVGYTQLLIRRYRGKFDAGADEFLAYTAEGAARMQDLLRDLLAYARVGTQGAVTTATDLAVCVERALANLQAAIEESGALVRYQRLPTVSADASQIAQLFQNLIANAIKFRSDAAPEVTISADRTDDGWRIAVRDNGIGIAPAYAGRVFEIFYRLHAREQYAGTGVGLAICKRIAERHGGTIWVEPGTDAGSVFLLTLPAAEDS